MPSFTGRSEHAVSVVVPILNADRWLDGFERNLRDVVSGADLETEILCVDNGSTDGTAARLDELSKRDTRFRFLRSPEKGIVSALNHGLKNARFPWIMRHDVDDVSSPRRLRRFVEALGSAREQVVLVASSAALADHCDRMVSLFGVPQGEFPVVGLSSASNPLIHGSVFLSREAALGVGGYRAGIPHAEDFDLWRRLAEGCPGRAWLGVAEPLYWFRFHASSVSSTRMAEQLAAVERGFGRGRSRGLWSSAEIGAIKRLVWEGNRRDAARLAIGRARPGIPGVSDWVQFSRLVAGPWLDLAHMALVRRRVDGVGDLAKYVASLG
jgi:glycosyltransferase involved in cell wall biosynthesis